MIALSLLLSACSTPKMGGDDPAKKPVVDPAAEVVEVPAVPCAGNAAHFAAHGTTLALAFHDEKSATRFQWMVDNVRRADNGAYCEVATGPRKGEFVPMSCLQPVDGEVAASADCPVAVTCLYRTADGTDCATGQKPVATPADGISAEEAYRLAASAYQKASDEPPKPAAPKAKEPEATLTNTAAAPPEGTSVATPVEKAVDAANRLPGS
jgi:hypothetical protein